MLAMFWMKNVSHFLFMKLTRDWEDGSRDLHLREKVWRGGKQMCRKRRWGCSPDILDPTHRHEQLRSSFHKNKQCHFAVRPSEISYLLSRDNSGMADERDRQRKEKKERKPKASDRRYPHRRKNLGRMPEGNLCGPCACAYVSVWVRTCQSVCCKKKSPNLLVVGGEMLETALFFPGVRYFVSGGSHFLSLVALSSQTPRRERYPLHSCDKWESRLRGLGIEPASAICMWCGMTYRYIPGLRYL